MKKKKNESAMSRMRERARRRAEERARQREQGQWNRAFNYPEDVELFTVPVPKKGKFVTKHLDIIPFRMATDYELEGIKKGEMWYRVIAFTHPSVGVDEKTYLCPKTFGNKERCPICEEYHKLRKDPNADESLIKALRPRQRHLFNVVDIDDEDKGVQIWNVSAYKFGDPLEETAWEEDDEVFFADLEDGRTLAVKFHKKKFRGREFMEPVNIEFEERDEPYGEEIVDEATPLDEILTKVSYKELKEVFEGVEDEDEENEEDEDKEKSSRRKSFRTHKGRRMKDNDDEEDDKEEEEEEEENHKKTKHKRQKSQEKVEDEEEEEEEVEDDFDFDDFDED